MKFTSILCAIAPIFAAPMGESTQSNYDALANAISTFESTSDYTFELILAAIGTQKKLLNSVSAAAAGTNLEIFLPSDGALLNLNIMSLSSNDLYNYWEYHVSANPIIGNSSYLKTYLGEDFRINTNSTGTFITSAYGAVSTVVGTASPIANIKLFFVDHVFSPPQSLLKTSMHYSYSNFVSILTAASTLTIENESKENTYLIPSEKALTAFLTANCKTVSAILPSYLTALVQAHTFNSSRYYYETLNTSNSTSLTTLSGANVPFTTLNGTITFTGKFNNASTVLNGTNIFVEHGVAHVIDAVLLPSNGPVCV